MSLNVLFLCTHNSCRSIIAQGLLEHYGKGKFKAYSAGSLPSGKVNSKAIEILKKNKIKANYNSFKSKGIDSLENTNIDVVITVCDSAANESCPIFLSSATKANWGVFDPSKVNEKEANEAFEKTFKILKKRIVALTTLNIEKFTTEELKDELDKIGKIV